MAKTLRVDEMLAVLHNIKHPCVSVIAEMEKTIAGICGKAIAETLAIEADAPDYDMDLGGHAVRFYAKSKGQPCPDALMDFDPTEWTDEWGLYLNPQTGEVLA